VSGFVEHVLNLRPLPVYLVVPALVFAEDAIFVGFVIPGETAAVLGGVVASRGHVQLWLIMLLVVAAAIVGDTVGYEVGRLIGPRLLRLRIFKQRQQRLADAQESLRRRGGWAVFFGRFVAFFRAVMPALAGASYMPYRRFLIFNAAGGVVWGVAFVLLGDVAGNSYKKVEKIVGRGSAVVLVLCVICAFVVWRVRGLRAERDDVSEDAA
jgi:membrane protein DedA with SNARE-associated domain